MNIWCQKKFFIDKFVFLFSHLHQYNQSNMQLDVRRLFQQAAKASVVHRVGGINQAFLSEVRQELTLKTDGINMQVLGQIYLLFTIPFFLDEITCPHVLFHSHKFHNYSSFEIWNFKCFDYLTRGWYNRLSQVYFGEIFVGNLHD